MSGFGGSVKLTGESEYRKALKDITSNLKLVSSELKLTNTEFSNGDKSIKETKTSYDNMGKTLQEQKEKISTLREALVQAEKEYGSNNEKVKMFKTQLNNAETQLKDMESQTDKSTSELKEMKEGLDDAGKGALTFGDVLKANILGDVIVGGLKKIGSAVLEVGKAFVDIGKQALDSYADYEQLEGGVETLFGTGGMTLEEYAESVGKSVDEAVSKYDELDTAQGEVIANANKAYKSAGMSANEYMETVTSFSASLISSLNGDTLEAAKVADMAIIDMSDNANKMGTDISSIQSAYQGFAKQNYTMLDNLKLGYGGTKTEMERLLSDAEKLSGQKYDISNLNDVYEAIHVVQTEMGITGTTAKEASQTISGSISSMGSAWQNLLTGLANGNADLTGLINNVVDSALSVVDNIMPVIEQVTNSIMEILPTVLNKIIEYLPQFLESGSNILTSLIEGLQNNMSSIMTAVMQIITTLINAIIENLPEILQMGITLLTSLIQGIAEALPEIIPAMIDAVILMVETLIDNIDLIIDAGIELLIGLAEGLIEALPKLIDKIPVIIEKLIMAFTNNLPKIIEMGITLIVKLAVGLVKAIPQLVSKIPQIITAIVSGISNEMSKLWDVGKNLVSGLWQGISNSLTWIKNKITGWVGNVVDFIKGLFGIHSPSTVFRDEIGTNLALGLGEGFENEMEDVNKEMANAIQTDYDLNVNSNLSGTSATSSSSTYSNMVDAFKEALSQMKIELDDEVAGKFVERTVTDLIYT